MGFAGYTDDDGTLLYGFLCVFDLEDATLRGALASSVRIQALCGRVTNKVTASLSYWFRNMME